MQTWTAQVNRDKDCLMQLEICKDNKSKKETLTGTYIKTDKERQRLTQADKYRQTGKETQKDKGKQIDRQAISDE